MASDKDSLIALCENFIINLDELATLSKSEINNTKSMFSKEADKSRRPFDKRPINRARTANFWGSTNNEEFLTDETGSVRWLCFEILDINKSYSTEVDINKIWAEAYYLFLNDFHYQLTQSEILENEAANKNYHVQSVEIQLIQMNYKTATKENHSAFYTATDFLENLSNKYQGKFKLNNIQLGKALKFLGFEKSQKSNGVYQVKGYYVDFIS